MTHTTRAALTQSHALLPIPTADTFGACSTLFELGGMIVIHDPSGCNSTYTTHDEPRWYDTDSLLFISALTEYDAILGRDDKLIHDIETSAKEFHPAFICILPSQIAHLIATDLPAISRIIERDTHIPTFTLPTNSMHPYDKGIEYALERLAHHLVNISSRPQADSEQSERLRPSERMPSRSQAILREGGGFHKETFSCKETEKSKPTDVNQQPQNSSSLSGRVSVVSVGSPRPTATTNAPSRPRLPRVNLLGLTPLDYHWQRALPSLNSFLTTHHLALASSLTLHTTLAAIEQTAPTADVNLVLTASALPAAKILETALHIPYIAAVPYPPIADEIAAALHQAAKDKKSRILYGCGTSPMVPSPSKSSESLSPTSATPPAAPGPREVSTGDFTPLRGGLRESTDAEGRESPKDSVKESSVESVGTPCPPRATNLSSKFAPPTNLLLTEPLASHSLRAALSLCGHPFTILPPPASEPSFQATLSTAATRLSDPLYFPLAPKAVKTIPLPRRAISGRTFEKKERNLLDQAEWAALLQKLQP